MRLSDIFVTKAILALLIIATSLYAQSSVRADSFSYTAGVVCVGINAAEEKKLKRNSGSLFNTSKTSIAQVYCSAPSVEVAARTKVRITVNARKGNTSRDFKGAFALHHPTTGKQLAGQTLTATSARNKYLKFGPPKLLIANIRSAFNQVRLWIPPQSSVYSIYTKYTGDTAPASQTRPEAFAWADRPASNTAYNASPSFSYNSDSKANTILRTATGRYTVKFNGVGGSVGNVQVTAEGTPSVFCQVANWTNATNVEINVACYNPNGDAANAKFSVSYKGI